MEAVAADPFGVRDNDVGNRFCEFKIFIIEGLDQPMNPA
jgi:hypothetical protein